MFTLKNMFQSVESDSDATSDYKNNGICKPELYTLKVQINEARYLSNTNRDYYCLTFLNYPSASSDIQATSIVYNTTHPTWKEDYQFGVQFLNSRLVITLWDSKTNNMKRSSVLFLNDFFTTKSIGELLCEGPNIQISKPSTIIEKWFPLSKPPIICQKFFKNSSHPKASSLTSQKTHPSDKYLSMVSGVGDVQSENLISASNLGYIRLKLELYRIQPINRIYFHFRSPCSFSKGELKDYYSSFKLEQKSLIKGERVQQSTTDGIFPKNRSCAYFSGVNYFESTENFASFGYGFPMGDWWEMSISVWFKCENPEKETYFLSIMGESQNEILERMKQEKSGLKTPTFPGFLGSTNDELHNIGGRVSLVTESANFFFSAAGLYLGTTKNGIFDDNGIEIFRRYQTENTSRKGSNSNLFSTKKETPIDLIINHWRYDIDPDDEHYSQFFDFSDSKTVSDEICHLNTSNSKLIQKSPHQKKSSFLNFIFQKSPKKSNQPFQNPELGPKIRCVPEEEDADSEGSHLSSDSKDSFETQKQKKYKHYPFFQNKPQTPDVQDFSPKHSNLEMKDEWDDSDELNKSAFFKKNEWNNLMIVYDGFSLKEYINGNLFDAKMCFYQRINLSKKLVIGGRMNGPEFHGFKGYLDEIRLFNFALSEKKIKKMYKLFSQHSNPK